MRHKCQTSHGTQALRRGFDELAHQHYGDVSLFPKVRSFSNEVKNGGLIHELSFSQTKLQLLAKLLRDQLQGRALAKQADIDFPNQQTIREEEYGLLHVNKTN